MVAMEYTVAEYCDMDFIYGTVFGNSAEAKTLYTASFPYSQIPSDKVFIRVHSRLSEVGSFEVIMRDTGWPRIVRSLEFEEDVLETFDVNPQDQWPAKILKC